VRSAHNPSQYHLVSGDGEGLRCSCPDFEKHVTEDPNWTCKHILAVENYQKKDYQAKTAGQEKPESYEAAERAAIASEAAPQREKSADPPKTQMLVKRSLSPDGRIDSISLEFSFDLAEESATNVKSRALKALKLQTEIVQSFLGSSKSTGRGNGNSNARPNGFHLFNGHFWCAADPLARLRGAG
jgi:hypothetical protein